MIIIWKKYNLNTWTPMSLNENENQHFVTSIDIYIFYLHQNFIFQPEFKVDLIPVQRSDLIPEWFCICHESKMTAR